MLDAKGTAALSGLLAGALCWLLATAAGVRGAAAERPEALLLAGLAGAVCFFCLLLFVGNCYAAAGLAPMRWASIGLCEAGALLLAARIHRAAATLCLVFSVPVVVYVKWAATKVARRAEAKKCD
jgi:hypothetical protein